MTTLADQRGVAILREVSGCPPSHTLTWEAVDDPLIPPTWIVTHNGQPISIPIGDLDDYRYNAWSDIKEKWRSKAADLHRESVFDSDWPVF